MIRAALALMLACVAAACGDRPQAMDWPPPAPALWEATAPGGQRGWLFGTTHALPAEVRWRTPALERAIGDARLLVVEVAALEDEAAGRRAFASVAYSPGLPPLLQRVPPRSRPALARALRDAGLTEADLATSESWSAALAILNAGGAEENAQGVDRALLAGDLPVAGLESHARLFAIFDTLSPEDQNTLLALAATMRDPVLEARITASWLTGDTAAMERELARGLLADRGLRDALLVRRNAAWLPQVARFIAEGRRPLVAVGAAHLLGPEGLPAQLAARGYRIRRLQ